DEPSFSPDGKFLAYTTDERGNLDVVVLPLSGGEPIRIADSDADEAQPAWSPDGSKVAFVSARDHGGRLGVGLNLTTIPQYLNTRLGDVFLAPALGGSPTKLVEDGYYPAWSPDGRRIVFGSQREGQPDLWTISAEGGSPSRLTNDPEIDFQPSWSPNGNWIVYASKPIGIGSFNLRVIAAGGGNPRVLTKDFGSLMRPGWSPDGGTIFFSGERDGILSLWRIPFSDGAGAAPSRVTVGQGQDVNVSVSRDGKKIAFAVVRNDPNIWELTVESGQLRAVTSGAGSPDYPRLSPDGRTLLVTSNRTGGQAAWTVDLSGKFLSQLTPAQGSDEPLAQWSPDGRQIAYAHDGRVWIQTVGGMNARDTGVHGSFVAWSPDGKTIAFAGCEPSQREICVLSLEEGKARPITSLKKSANNPTWSPDGKQIAFYTGRGAIRELWVVPSTGGAPRQLTSDSEDSHPDWSPKNPDEILFLRDHKRLAILSVSTGRVRFLPGYSEGNFMLDYPSWSPDGKRVYFSVFRKSGDIYVLEGF
ncbi:MAG TPA: hypothetical protein VKG01_10185, partial [Thermoanaerobaculia bacterium]|nr:hypothetical protein [Thermoanaerobaculia bacterium]